ncbi:PfkB domain protein [Alkaliphilus metalliredigens QYMF]|uniref:PfkB domain protein n=1 Tax=Alkaliphilus metalliredigens (strain QYMF) TaxID=293826 RepID=A6TL59_ALKMQ|nr:PfkB family carbohydrate kinase [Alkaliphilus metalliredigens]ABR46927.1 PfkB domain protein [Alkaliphilus metalliredigens QYMF]
MKKNCTEREKEIVEKIQRDPMISQQKLAMELGIARSSVAAHITNLMKKGIVLGKGYVVSQEPYVCVIGGANIDIQGKPIEKLIERTSNPGQVEMSVGGVGRNIAHNLSLLQIQTQLITALGKDAYGDQILIESRAGGVRVDHSLILEGESSGVYLALLDEAGEMNLALSQMDIFERLSPGFLEEKRHVLAHAKVIVVDTNLTRNAIEYIIGVAEREGIPLFLDTVSIAKAEKVKDLVGCFHTIKPNVMELEMLTGHQIENDADLKKGAEALLAKGVQEVVISLGNKGAFYHDGENYGQLSSPEIPVVSTTGAGDAFVAGLIYGTIENKSLREKVLWAMGCGALTAASQNTVNQEMSVQSVVLINKENVTEKYF